MHPFVDGAAAVVPGPGAVPPHGQEDPSACVYQLVRDLLTADARADHQDRPDRKRVGIAVVGRMGLVDGRIDVARQDGLAGLGGAADGRGEADPLTSNATEEGRARNCRVELILSRQP